MPTDDSNGIPGGSNPLTTIGSYPKGKKARRSLSQFGTVQHDDDSKYIILEERTFHYSTSELRPENQADLERIRGTRQEGW
jgi:hypothetical protein